MYYDSLFTQTCLTEQATLYPIKYQQLWRQIIKNLFVHAKRSANKPNYSYQTQWFGYNEGYIVTIHYSINNITDEETGSEKDANITSVKTQIERAF